MKLDFSMENFCVALYNYIIIIQLVVIVPVKENLKMLCNGDNLIHN